MRKMLVYLLIALALVLGALPPAPAGAQMPGELPAIAIDQSIGPGGTQINYTGVGFTPNGRVTVLLTKGLGLIVSETTADANGFVAGAFQMPANVPEVGTSGRVSVFAIDAATGRETLSAFFVLTQGRLLDYDLPHGHFFTQTNGNPLGVGTSGYAVVNNRPFTVPVAFWDEFRRLGGVPLVGYPISQVFILDGFVTQVFQKAVFQWRPEAGEAFFVNVFDVLHDRGFDDFLAVVRSTPRPLGPEFDAGKTRDQIVADRLALLNENPAMRAVYFSVDNPLLRFGLPTSRVEDMGNHFVIRLQRAVLQQWKVAVPWAAPGQVTIANGGAIGVEVGLYPEAVTAPQPQPTWSSRVVNYFPAKGARVQSGFLLEGDAQVFEAVATFQLLGANGNVLAEGPAMTTVAAPEFGRYSLQVNFNVSREQPGILRVFERSARDGSIVEDTLVSIPVTLVP